MTICVIWISANIRSVWGDKVNLCKSFALIKLSEVWHVILHCWPEYKLLHKKLLVQLWFNYYIIMMVQLCLFLIFPLLAIELAVCDQASRSVLGSEAVLAYCNLCINHTMHCPKKHLFHRESLQNDQLCFCY